MNRLALFRDLHRGERGVIVANGPSLNAMDLSCLAGETVIGLNKIFLGLDRFGFYPRYYIAVNRKVVEQSVRQIQALNCVKFIGDRAKDLLPEDGLTHHLNTSAAPARFCHDIAAGVHEGWTVTYAALQVAWYLGFAEVVLVGLDHRYRFEGAPNALHRLEGPDPNHFAPGYFGGGQEWNNPDLARSEESYRLARAEFEAAGRRITDATVNGACTIFPKADYRDVFRE
jgi:hypothetical protein